MIISDAQKELRMAYLGGFAGQLAAGMVWVLSSAVSTWISPHIGMAALFFAGMLLYPLTRLLLWLMGCPVNLSPGNTLDQLAAQIAFIVPIGFILVGAATLYRERWFYPASMVIVGAHYLPFIFLYGMWQFGVLAAGLIAGGIVLGLYGPDIFSLGGWLSAVMFILFAFFAWGVVKKEASAFKN